MILPKQNFDAVIIGGGGIGCSIAWRLAQAGMRVAVVEQGEIGREAVWAAGGMLAPFAEANHANAFFEFAVQGCRMYADFARELFAATAIDIAYRTEGTLYLAFTDEDEEELEHRWQWQHATGLNVKKLKADCVHKLEPALNRSLRWALKFPDDHQVDNRKMIVALEQAARQVGVTFFTQTKASSILTQQASVAGVVTSQGELNARAVVVAAGCWAGTLQKNLPVQPVRGQMMTTEMSGAQLNHVVYSSRGYLIPRRDGKLIAGSTTEHVGFEKAVTPAGLQKILAQALEIMPALAQFPITETWSGLRPHSADEWPILGTDPQVQGLIYATGHYRNGILLTPITARVISELILSGASSIDISAFHATRFTERATA